MHRPADPHHPARPADLLLSPLLLGALALLVVNDWVLKPAFHNALTGKLSDFAGVAALALFLRAVVPGRAIAACVAAGAAFALWKSPASQPLIDGINALGWAPVGRVVDWTDLAALLVLPIVRGYRPRRAAPSRMRRVLAPVVGTACVLAFAATTSVNLLALPDTEYPVPLGVEEVRARVETFPDVFLTDRRARTSVDTLHLRFATEPFDLTAEARPAESGSVLRLLGGSYLSYHDDVTAERAVRVFERVIVEPLRTPAQD
jgi:hypothetical protein